MSMSMIDTQTDHTHTQTQRDNTQKPKLASGKIRNTSQKTHKTKHMNLLKISND